MFAKGLLAAESVCVFVIALSVLGHKFLSLPFKLSFGLFGLALLISIIVMLLGLIALIFGLVAPEVKSKTAMVVLTAALPLVAIFFIIGPASFKVPRIHDISTDLHNNLEFVHAKKLRSASENSLDFPGEDVKQLQEGHYKDIAPVFHATDPDEVFSSCLALVDELGWKLIAKDESARVLEAYAETAFFGFKDDIVIRVSESDMGSRIDMRSVSRVGVSDLGANAARILAFQQALKNKL